MNKPLRSLPFADTGPEKELDSAGAVIGVDGGHLPSVDLRELAYGQGDDEERRHIEDLDEEASGGGGAKDKAFAPGAAEAHVVVGVEVGEQVGDGEVTGGAEAVDDETGPGD